LTVGIAAPPDARDDRRGELTATDKADNEGAEPKALMHMQR
jgi:hypothetical protein